jgi:hypothetical protein
MQVTYAIPGVAIQRITKNCTEGSDAALIESIAKGDRGPCTRFTSGTTCMCTALPCA